MVDVRHSLAQQDITSVTNTGDRAAEADHISRLQRLVENQALGSQWIEFADRDHRRRKALDIFWRRPVGPRFGIFTILAIGVIDLDHDGEHSRVKKVVLALVQ